MVNATCGRMPTQGAMIGGQFVQTKLLFESRYNSDGEIAWNLWKNLLQLPGFERDCR